jgi:hypothetical protein
MFSLLAALAATQAVAVAAPGVPAVRRDLLIDMAPKSVLRADVPEQPKSVPVTSKLVSSFLKDDHYALGGPLPRTSVVTPQFTTAAAASLPAGHLASAKIRTGVR